jgi:hypothetical protein
MTSNEQRTTNNEQREQLAMSKKHFIAIARAILETRETTKDVMAQAALTVAVIKLCTEFKAFNPKFDQDRFFRATGTCQS